MYRMQDWLYTINISNRSLVKDSTLKDLEKIKNELSQFITEHWKEFDDTYAEAQSPIVNMLNLAELLLRLVDGYKSGACIYKIDKD